MLNIFDDTDQIDKFIRNHSVAIVATIDASGQPNTSTIFYIIDKKGKIYFISKEQTIKSKNLKTNNKAAMTILDKAKPIAVNVIGFAAEVNDEADRESIQQDIFKLSYEELHDYAPIIKLHKGGFSVFSFQPVKATFTDFTKPIGQTKELSKEY